MPEEQVEIILYVNTGECITVSKALQYANSGVNPQASTIIGSFTSSFDIISPVIRIQTANVITLPNFNYVHIPVLKRYYYVNSVISISRNLWEIQLSVDVLMTYSKSINNFSGIVERNRFDINPLIADTLQSFESGYDIEVIEGENSLSGNGITHQSYNFIVCGSTVGYKEAAG